MEDKYLKTEYLTPFLRIVQFFKSTLVQKTLNYNLH